MWPEAELLSDDFRKLMAARLGDTAGAPASSN
jgi:hypothetical protein